MSHDALAIELNIKEKTQKAPKISFSINKQRWECVITS